MDYTDILNLNTGSRSLDFHMVEAVIGNLLKTQAESEGKSLTYDGDHSSSKFYDVYAPDGIGEIEGETYIDIVTNFRNLRPIERAIKAHEYLSKNGEYTVIFLCLSKPPPKIVKEIASLYIDHGINASTWGPEKVDAFIKENEVKVNEFIKKMFSLRLASTIEKPQNKWDEERSKILGQVKLDYKSKNFSLFLGSGVSSSSGLPDWNTLLNSLFVSLLTDGDSEKKEPEIAEIVSRLRKLDGPSALTSARYIRKGFASSGSSDQKEFIDTVTSNLYGLQNKSRESKLISEIISLCRPKRGGTNIKSVITYNFDDLIEKKLEEAKLDHKSIFEESDTYDENELPLYHVHGFLPEEREKYNNLDKSTLVFSEEGYHQIYNDPYHWSNLVQLNHLRETYCLMIGLSMTDPNLRRLLEIANRSSQSIRHYTFLKRIHIDEFMQENGKSVINASENTVRKFLDRHHSLHEGILGELGVKIIWYEDYDEIPRLLSTIRS